MPQYLPLPDGSSVTIREGETPQQTWARAQQMYPEAFGVKAAPQEQPQGGFIAASKAGLAGLKGDVAALAGRTGLMDEASAEKYIKEQEEYKKRTFKPTEESFLEAPFTKTKELLGGSLPYMAAPLAAGVLAPAGLPAIGAAGLASLTQFTGSNLSRQMDEGKKLGETNLGYAAAAALPQAALDMVSFRMAPGIRNLFAVAGKEVPEKAALEIAKQGTAQIAKDYALATGKAMSAEGLTEAGQQFFERMQAGLNLTDEKARDEYWQSLVGGAVLGGVLAPAGRYVERGAQQGKEEQAAIKKRTEEARAEKEAEDIKRQSPEYLTTFAQGYEEREAKFKAEKAALKKPGKDATPEEQFDYKERKTALDDLYKSLVGDTPEYKRVKPLVEQVQEQQRVEKLSPEEYMLEQTMQGGRGAAPAPTGGRMKGALGINEVPEPPKPDTRVADYATGQIDTARSMGLLDVKDYVDYLMQDPKMAADTLKQRPALPGLDNQAQKAVFDGLRLNLRDREKAAQAESKAELAQRTEDYKAQQVQPKPDPLERYLASEQQVEEHRATAETNFDYLNDMFTSAMGGKEPTIEINNEVKATADSVRKAPQIRQRVEELLQEADQADTDYANALKGKAPKGYGTGLTGQQQAPLAAKEAFERGNAAIDRLTSMSESGSPYAKEVLKLRQQQNFALNNLEDIADKLRRQETLGKNEMAASTTQSLTNEAARMRSQYIQAALKEAATHRRAEGKPELTKDEAIKAASEMYDTLNEWIDRVQKEPQRNTMESVLVEPAQLRAHKLIRQARYEQRRVFDERPIEQYRFGAYPQAVAVLKEQLDTTRRNLWAKPNQATRQESFLKTQFPETEAKKVAETKGETAKTLGGELRRRSEYTLTNLEKVLARGDLPQGGIYEGVKNGQPYVYRVEDMRELLEKARDAIAGSVKAQDFYDRVQTAVEDGTMKEVNSKGVNVLDQASEDIKDKQVSRDLLDAVDAQVERIMRGEDTGTALVRAKETVSEKRVVRNVPGKEGYTEFGMRRKTQEATREEERAPLSEYQRDIEDALKAFAPTAMEQKEAGQKSLFPETEEDIGYIRMSPKNFANSPKIRSVWEALDAARAATKRKADKEQKVAARSKAMAETIRRIQTNIELLKKDTKFFWIDPDIKKWTDKQLAQAAIEYPEVGNTPEETALVNKYLTTVGRTKGSKPLSDTEKAQALAGFSEKEKKQIGKLLRNFQETKLVEYQKHLKQAEQLIAQGERLDDLDNQLLRTMQDTNKSIRDSAEKLRRELAPLRTAIEHIKDSARKNKKETPLMKQIKAIEVKADKARSAYRQRVEEMYDTAYKNMDAALAEILDPEIAKAQAGLKKAAETLEKQKAELERVQQKVKDVLAQPSGKDRMLLATYEQFRYEEKKSVIEDLENKIQEQEKDLADMMETREEAHDTAAAVLQAVSDKKTQNIFEKVVALETQLATLRGEEVTATAGVTYKYPFAQQKLGNDLKAARAQLEATQKEQKATNDKIKSSKEQVKKQTAEFGVSVTRRELNKKEREELAKAETALVVAEKKQTALRKQLDSKLTKKERKALEVDLDQTELAINQLLNTRLRLQTQIKPLGFGRLEKNTDVEALLEQKELDKLSKESRQQSEQADEARRKKEIRDLQLQQIDEEVGDLVAELGAYENLPNDSDTLRQLSEDENTRPKQRNEALAKLGVLQNIESLEAQRAAVLEGKPQKKQAAATTETSLAQSARKAFRTGDVEAQAEREYQQMSREDQRLANLAAQEARGKKAEAAPKPSTRVQGKTFNQDVGLFEDEIAQSLSDTLDNLFAEPKRVPATLAPRATPAPANRAMPARKPVSINPSDFTSKQSAKALDTTFDETAPFHGMTFAQAAKYGAERTTSPQVRALFEKLGEVFASAPEAGGSGRVYAVNGPIRQRYGGMYNNRYDVVYTRAPSKFAKNANKILLHELTHAATSRAMQLNPELREQVEALRKQVVDWLETPQGRTYYRQHSMNLGRNRQSIYGLTNADEFLAELYSDRDFQKMLVEIPSTKPRKNIFTRFVELMTKFFDMPAKAAQSVFAEAVALSEDILATTKSEIYESNTPLQEFKDQALPYVSPEYANDEARDASVSFDKFVAKQKTSIQKVRAAAGGFVGLETQLVDRFAGFERISKVMAPLQGAQMMYYLRMYDQRMNFVSQAVAHGALKRIEKTRADGSKENIIESNEGASIRGVVETLRDAKKYIGNGEAVNRMFTAYMSAIRAKSKGFETLNFDKDVTEADILKAEQFVNKNAALKSIFEDARRQYNEYNRDMLQFVADSGAISEATRKELMQENDYIPWYRERNGVAELIIGKSMPIRIGSIAEQPYLHELVGGDKPILDFMTSAVQNTNMLADMGLRNFATKNAVFELVDMQMAKIVGATSGPNVVKFKKDGKDMYASIDGMAGIPGDLLVKGMAGIPTQMPAIWRLLAMPARLLRKAVTLSPLYAARQLFRDSVAAPILSGANFVPVLGALKEVNSATKKTLERRGVTGGQVFTGTSEDLTKILRDITDGKPGWMNLLAKAEALNMEADATTRRAQYNSYIAQGLSEMEATLMALESMNFNKRGAEPSIHIIGSLIPFFNAQIQALNVLYKALTGKMPFNERLKIQEKLLQRGGLLAGATLAYAVMMQDDEAYKNATPEQKYGNWFVRIPGVDEPIRIPVPFEIGYVFKAIPEALYNSMVNEHGDEEAVKAFKQILLQTIPGGTSYGMPQAAKPLIEYGLGKSFYTGRDILSAHEKSLLPEEQFRTNTSEAAKLIGKVAGTSPILLEELVKGYTGTMGLAFLQAVSVGIPKGNTPEQAATRLSELPVVGGAFQPNDAAGIINATYDRFENAIKLQRTVDSMFNEGRAAEGMALLNANMNEYMAGEMGDYFTNQMKELTQLEKAVQAMDITPEEKRQRLTDVRKLKISVAESSRRVVDKIAPQ